MSESQEPQVVLLVDDEADLLVLLEYNFQKEGFSTLTARNGAHALDLAEKHLPSLIVMDVMMPVMDGVEAVKRIRQHAKLRHIPVMMLTARAGEDNLVEGLDVGADVYLVKGIATPVILSQAKALLRGASRNDDQPDTLRVHDLEINRERYLVFRDEQGERIAHRLPRKEFELLYYLASYPGKVFTRQDMLDRVWGRDVYVVDRTVDVHVRKIREKLGEDYIETVKGIGYRFRK
jgi:two-component system alkaline phosphatase synthesis response regulator PhoP